LVAVLRIALRTVAYETTEILFLHTALKRGEAADRHYSLLLLLRILSGIYSRP